MPAVVLAACLFSILASAPSLAQAPTQDAPAGVAAAAAPGTSPALPQDEAPPPPPRHTGLKALFANVGEDFVHVASREAAGWTLAGGTLALAVHPFDAGVNRHLVGKAAVHNFFLPGKIIGQGYFQAGAALLVYGAGRIRHQPRVAHVGMDLLRAEIVVGTLTYGLKFATHRRRPDGSDWQSFPSGHASSTFASALVLQRHLGWWSLPTLLVASYTATSRLHENRHYLSDVVGGATLGVIVGRTITRHGRSNYALVPVAGNGTLALLVVRGSRQ